MPHTDVITRRGGTPKKAIDFIKENPTSIQNYKIIILHVGTNWLSHKEEWGLYLKLANGLLSKEAYDSQLASLNPPPATGDARIFRDTYQELIDLVRETNPIAIILISSIIPRAWDHDRRDLVRMSYNQLLKNLATQENVFFIRSYGPFFHKDKSLRKDLFDWDGLHLSNKRAMVLRTFFSQQIDKAKKREN